MKQLSLFISFSIFFVHLTAQSTQSSQQFTFKQLGLSFTAPTGFALIDSSTHTLSPNSEIVVWRQQFVFQNSDAGIVFSISTSTQKGIDWNNVYKKEDKQYYDQMRIRKPGVKFDSSSTIEMLDSQLFNKFTVTSKENDKVTTHKQFSKFFKGYRINIAYTYTKPETEAEIENSLRSIKFSN